MKVAIYPFSGDPITYGHIDMIKRASAVFDRVIAAVGINPLKEYTFPIEVRLAMATEALKELPNVEVCSYKGLLADLARDKGTNIIVRGIRNSEDFDYEWMINQINESIDSRLETFWMPCRKDKALISSSTVKELWNNNSDIKAMVPEVVLKYFSHQNTRT
jgi:pantetheine-phosphate adenylyltransferase